MHVVVGKCARVDRAGKSGSDDQYCGHGAASPALLASAMLRIIAMFEIRSILITTCWCDGTSPM
jgi:hypothetical protein